jgi:adenylate cyclase
VSAIDTLQRPAIVQHCPFAPPSEKAVAAADVKAWLLNEARLSLDPAETLAGVCRRLRASGVPIDRVSVNIRTLHPQVGAIRVMWRSELAAPVESTVGHDVASGAVFLNSPFYVIYNSGKPVRRRLEDPESPDDFPILADLRTEGVTDYYVAPIFFANGRTQGTTWASRRPGGFEDADIAAIEAVLPALSLVAEVQEARRISKTLLDTYLGPQAGARVLNGSIRRGDAETISAALWFCDMRGFTELSERLPREQVIATLNEYFGCVAEPIHAHGGEILKFIGDAVLAIFPMKDDLDRDRACNTALVAAKEALAGLEALNGRRVQDGHQPIRIGLALHAGAVTYGNIGAADRLDFTVIGPAVNLVTRIEGLCPVLGRPLLASARFASPCGSELVPVGRYKLRGIADEQEVYGLPG